MSPETPPGWLNAAELEDTTGLSRHALRPALRACEQLGYARYSWRGWEIRDTALNRPAPWLALAGRIGADHLSRTCPDQHQHPVPGTLAA